MNLSNVAKTRSNLKQLIFKVKDSGRILICDSNLNWVKDVQRPRKFIKFGPWKLSTIWLNLFMYCTVISRMHTMIMYFNWFTTAFIMYGLALSWQNLTGGLCTLCTRGYIFRRKYSPPHPQSKGLSLIF